MTKTAVYVCSENYLPYLKISLNSLLYSASSFDWVDAYVVEPKNGLPDLSNPRVRLHRVGSVREGYWLANKWHLTASDCDRLIFLDTDTLVVRPIDFVECGTADITARVVPGIVGNQINVEKWNENWLRTLKYFGVADRYPYMSCGFMLFQNGAHKRIAADWLRIMDEILTGNSPLEPTRFVEQQALSLAAARIGLTYKLMERKEHVYLMNNESVVDGIVLHLGTPNFYAYSRNLIRVNPDWRKYYGSFASMRLWSGHLRERWHRFQARLSGRKRNLALN